MVVLLRAGGKGNKGKEEAEQQPGWEVLQNSFTGLTGAWLCATEQFTGLSGAWLCVLQNTG